MGEEIEEDGTRQDGWSKRVKLRGNTVEIDEGFELFCTYLSFCLAVCCILAVSRHEGMNT